MTLSLQFFLWIKSVLQYFRKSQKWKAYFKGFRIFLEAFRETFSARLSVSVQSCPRSWTQAVHGSLLMDGEVALYSLTNLLNLLSTRQSFICPQSGKCCRINIAYLTTHTVSVQALWTTQALTCFVAPPCILTLERITDHLPNEIQSHSEHELPMFGPLTQPVKNV